MPGHRTRRLRPGGPTRPRPQRSHPPPSSGAAKKRATGRGGDRRRLLLDDREPSSESRVGRLECPLTPADTSTTPTPTAASGSRSPDPRTGRRPAPSSVGRRLSALSSFYRYAKRHHGAVAESPFADAARPSASEDSATTGLNRDELRRLVATAHADGPRSAALIALLADNGLRVTEALSRDIEHLEHDQRHRVLRLERKGGKRATAPLSPAVRALEAYVGERTTGPLFITSSGRRLDRTAAWRLVRRLARAAGIVAAEHISPHSARHALGTGAFDAGVPLRDVQDAMGHADPRTTRRYDRSRHGLDRRATYAVAAWLAEDERPSVSAPRLEFIGESPGRSRFLVVALLFRSAIVEMLSGRTVSHESVQRCASGSISRWRCSASERDAAMIASSVPREGCVPSARSRSSSRCS